VSNIRVSRRLVNGDRLLVEFDYTGRPFVIVEPFGDNSRFLIAPRVDTDSQIDVSELCRLFGAYQPPPVTRVMGDLVRLKFLRRSD
jgi:hypothetical protein